MLEGKTACDRGEEKQVEKHLRVSVTGYADLLSRFEAKRENGA